MSPTAKNGSSKKKMVKNNKLSLHNRIRVLQQYRKYPYITTLSKRFRCSYKQIKQIIDHKTSILTEYIRVKCYNEDLHQVELMERVLYEWFQRAQRHKESGAITNDIILEKAEEVKQIICMSYQTDQDWLLKFRIKYELTDLEMTLLRIENNTSPIVLDLAEIAASVVDPNFENSDNEADIYNPKNDRVHVYLPSGEFSTNNRSKISHNVSENICETYILQMGEHGAAEDSDADVVVYAEQDSSSLSEADVEAEPANFVEQDDNNGSCQAGETYTVESVEQDNHNCATLNADETHIVELTCTTIANNEEARRYLKPLESYFLMKSNFQAIGLIERLEQLFNSEK